MVLCSSTGARSKSAGGAPITVIPAGNSLLGPIMAPGKGKRFGREAVAVPGIRAHVFVAASVLAIGIFLYTNSVIGRLKAEAATQSASIASLCATTTYAARDNEELRMIFGNLIDSISFPIVITDARGIPITWKGLPVDVDPYDISHEEYTSADPGTPQDSQLWEVVSFLKVLDERHSPIPMTRVGENTVLGYVHYGESSMIREMRFVPALELLAFGVLAFLGFHGFRNAKLAELRSIWVGMARETAHQLGTPISSLLGWVELMKESSSGGCVQGEISRMASEMQRDLERLEKVSLRFNQIGSIPKTERQDVVIVVRGAISYLRSRLNMAEKSTSIEETYSELPLVDINGELMEWVVENLMKNSLEALKPEGGRIEVSSVHSAREGVVKIRFADNGRGLSLAERRHVFAPGYSTKRKGWGLGLALSRRIVEDYHKGRLYIEWSEPGQGTTFVVSLPAT